MSTLILLHFLTQGLQILVNQTVARRDYDGLVYIYSVATTTCLFFFPFMVHWAHHDIELRHNGFPEAKSLVVIAAAFLVLGGAYSAMTYARLKAQRVLPTYVFAPLSRTSLLIVVLVSVVFLDERRSWMELFAIGFMFLPLTTLRPARETPESFHYVAGIVWTVFSVVCSSGLQIASKLAVDPSFGIGAAVVVFAFGVNAGNMVMSAVARLVSTRPAQMGMSALLWGVLGGCLNVGSFLTLTLFLVSGDASRIYPISSLSLVVPVVILRVLKKERRPTLWQFLALLLSLVAIYILVR